MMSNRQKAVLSLCTTFTFIKSVWFVVSFCVCVYIIGQRMKHYFSNPLTTHTEFIEKDSVQFPAVLFCRFGFTRYLTSGFLEEVKAKCKLENDCKELSLDAIKQYPLKKLNLSVEKYWDDYGIGINLMDNMVYCKYMTQPSKNCRGEHEVEANMTLKRTILGTCVEHYLGADFNYFGYYTYLTINIKEPLKFLNNSKIIEDVWLFVPDEKDYSLHEVFYGVRTIAKDAQIEAVLTRQSFHLISTKENPCTHSSHTQCINQCFNDLFHTNLTCNLPFFSASGFRTCATYKEAINMYAILYDIYESAATNHCKCHKMCEHTKMKTQVTLEKKILNNPAYSSSVTFRFSTHAILTVSHHYVYPFSALVSDIGGTIGFFLGVSIFTSFDIVKSMFVLLIERIKNKKIVQVSPGERDSKIMPRSIVSNYRVLPQRLPVQNHSSHVRISTFSR